jgi:hypothetical protein
VTTFVEKIVAVHEYLRIGQINHAFGGAIALGYHVEAPRATADIGLNIAADIAGARVVLRALPPGVSWAKADVAQIERDGQTRLFWDRTPVDLFFPQHELHDVVASRLEQVPFASTMIPIVSATDLCIFKAMFDRTKDWADIEAMLVYGEVDRPEVRHWLTRLLGEDDQRVARLDRLG